MTTSSSAALHRPGHNITQPRQFTIYCKQINTFKLGRKITEIPSEIQKLSGGVTGHSDKRLTDQAEVSACFSLVNEEWLRNKNDLTRRQFFGFDKLH